MNYDRIVAITHIHELAAKDEELHKDLMAFYNFILHKADSKGIPVSKVFFNLNHTQHEKRNPEFTAEDNL